MSFMEELHTWVNAQPWIPAPIAFDVEPIGQPDPWFTMFPIGDEGLSGELCGSDTGRTIVQFNGYGTSRYRVHDDMEVIRRNVISARNALPTYSLWWVRTTGTIGYGTEDERIYRFTFDLETQWRIIP